MTVEHVKLAYSANQLRVRVSFDVRVCLELPEPPSSVMEKTRAKFQQEKRAGKLALFEVYEQEFISFWKTIRQKLNEGYKPDVHEMVFTLGCGSPLLPGVRVDNAQDSRIAFQLSLHATPDEAKQWRFDFLKININHSMKEAGISVTDSINFAQVYASWLRLCRGEKVVYRPIACIPNDTEGTKSFALLFNKAREEVALVIFKSGIFHDLEAMERLVRSCEDSSRKMEEQSGHRAEFLKKQLVERLKSARKGPESYGFALPAVYLVSYPQDPQPTPVVSIPVVTPEPIPFDAVVSAKSNLPVKEASKTDYAGKGLLKLKITPDNMSACIEGFNIKLYDHPDFTVSLDWIKDELTTLGIIYNSDPNIDETLKAAIDKGEDINSFAVAKGDVPVAPTKPFLFESYRTVEQAEIEASTDMRELQQRTIVNAGDIIAEVRYTNQGSAGQTIFGQTIGMPPGEALNFTVGDGIEQRGTIFYAKRDGLPKIEGNVITLNQALLHQGDVNFRTGNIHYNGSAEITGSIETGATVEVTGDLIVHGTIQGAYVRVGGTLEVRAGIVTGGKGIVRVKNDIIVQFIENSRIICGGNVIIAKACLNSKVVAGGNIQTKDKIGIIAGGNLSCKKNLQAGKLGFPVGALTVISAGVNWRAKLSYDIRAARIERLLAAAENDRSSLRELVRRKDNQKTKKHEQQAQDLQDRLVRLKALNDACTVHLQQAQKNITFNGESRVYILDRLHANVRVEIAGIAIPVTNDLLEVMLSPKRIRGNLIVPLNEAAEDKKAG